MENIKNLCIGVCRGGWSEEAAETVVAADDVIATLREHHHEVIVFVIDHSSRWMKKLLASPPDIMLLSVTEEVAIQPVLESLGIPYSGYSPIQSLVSFDKWLSKLVMRSYDIPIIDGIIVKDCAIPPQIDAFPVIVKPRRSGSSLGVSLVHKQSDIPQALRKAAAFDKHALIEPYVDGREITVFMFGDELLPPIEIMCERKIFDFETKTYSGDKLATYVKATLSPDEKKSLEKIISSLRDCFDHENFARVDLILSDTWKILEINTLPYMGKKGLLGVALDLHGMKYYDFLVSLLTMIWTWKDKRYQLTARKQHVSR